MEAADRRVGAVRVDGGETSGGWIEMQKKSIKLYVKYSRTLYVHGNFAKRLQSTTMTMVFRFFKYAAKRKRRIFSVTTINNVLRKQHETMRICTSKSVISQMLYIRLPIYDAWSDLKGVRLMDWKQCVILAAVKWNETEKSRKRKNQAWNGLLMQA